MEPIHVRAGTWRSPHLWLFSQSKLRRNIAFEVFHQTISDRQVTSEAETDECGPLFGTSPYQKGIPRIETDMSDTLSSHFATLTSARRWLSGNPALMGSRSQKVHIT